MKKILIADDHDIVRRGLRALFDEHPDLAVEGEASTAMEVLDRIREESWDLLVLDLDMPGGEGLETLRRVQSVDPDLPVIILSVHPEDRLAKRLLQAGASGYVQKDAASEDLIVATRRVLRGSRYVSPELASQLAADLGGDGPAEPHDELSEREFQVLRLIAEGKSVSGIAEELTLSVKTVSTYKSRLMKKMEMETTAELIRYAVERDLVR